MLGIVRTLPDLEVVASKVLANGFHSIIGFFNFRAAEPMAAGKIHLNDSHF